MDQRPPAPSVIPPTPADPIRALDAVDDELAGLADLTIAEHVEVFARVHQQLTSALAITGNQPTNQPSNASQRPGATGASRPGQPFGPRGH